MEGDINVLTAWHVRGSKTKFSTRRSRRYLEKRNMTKENSSWWRSTISMGWDRGCDVWGGRVVSSVLRLLVVLQYIQSRGLVKDLIMHVSRPTRQRRRNSYRASLVGWHPNLTCNLSLTPRVCSLDAELIARPDGDKALQGYKRSTERKFPSRRRSMDWDRVQESGEGVRPLDSRLCEYLLSDSEATIKAR